MTQPIAFSVAMLAWGLLAFPQSYTAAARAQTLQQIQVGTEYLQKTLVQYTPNNPSFAVIYQVGNISRESRYWGYPEAYTAQRPSFWVNSTGASDLMGSVTAAFAASSLALRKDNPSYAQELLQLASGTYLAAQTNPGLFSSVIQGTVCNTYYERAMINSADPFASSAVQRTAPCAGPDDAYNGSAIAWYNSTTYQDDLMWAATWMYEATQQQKYLNDSMAAYVAHTQGPESVYYQQLLFNWRNTFWGANLRLALLEGDAAYHQQMQYFLKYWLCATGGGPIQFTPLGRAWNANDGALGTTANAAFLSVLYAQTAA